MAIHESAFRFGCGRYIQQAGAFSLTGTEVLRFGRSALILGGRTALSVARETVCRSLDEAEVTYEVLEHLGSCNHEDAAIYAEQAEAYDVVIGIGGGVMMDLAKLVAHRAGKPLINLPTSAATCAAFTPLSVCYTREGKTVGTTHFSTEVNCVIVDTDCMVHQPPRLLLAGIFDALAKLPEIDHRYDANDPEMPLGLDYARGLAVQTYDFLYRNTDSALEALKTGTVTALFERMIFSAIAVTGVVSSIARGSNQTALAHKFYENGRRMDTESVKGYLHGELVGVGLLLQNLYNQNEAENPALVAWMQAYGLPSCPTELGLPADEATKQRYFEAMMHSSAMGEVGDGDRLAQAIDQFWK